VGGRVDVVTHTDSPTARVEIAEVTGGPIRVRWDDVLDVKGAALALTFGADELAGPLAPPLEQKRLAQVGGPPEDGHRPSPAYLETLIRAAGRMPARRR